MPFLAVAKNPGYVEHPTGLLASLHFRFAGLCRWDLADISLQIAKVTYWEDILPCNKLEAYRGHWGQCLDCAGTPKWLGEEKANLFGLA